MKTLRDVIVICLLAVIMGPAVFAAETQTATFSFRPSDFVFKKMDGFDAVYLKDGEISDEIGKPQLPVSQLKIALPAGAVVERINVVQLKFEPMDGDYHLFPAQPPRILSMESDVAFVAPDVNTYTSDDWYPTQVVDIDAPQFAACGDITLLTMRVSPVQYKPASKQLRLLTELNLNIEYSVQPSARRATPAVQKVAGVLSGSEFVPTRELRDISELKVYVIITSSSLSSTFEPLLEWKRKKGIPDTLVTTEWIYANYTGRDSQEKIRHFLQDKYEDWGIQWLLLGGDVNIVPDRIAWAMDCEAGFYPNENELSADLYYAALDGDWDANVNSIFGEVDDDVDLMPEIFVGRAPVEDATEAEAFVNKILTYEKTPDITYQRNALFFAEILWENPYTNSGLLKDLIDEESMPGRFDPITKLYEHNGNESPTSVLDAIEDGRSFLNHAGHANYSVMGAGSGYLYRSDMDGLYNPGKYGIIFSIGCWAAAIDYNCIAEHFVTNPNGGGIGFVGNSRYGWGSPGNPGWGYSEIIDRRFFSSIFNDNLIQPGLALAAAKAYYIPYSQTENVYRWHQYQLNLLGEPEMPLWTDIPGSIIANFPEDVLTGMQLFMVTVEDAGGVPIPGAKVCIMMEDDVYEVTAADAAGQASFSIAPISPGVLDVTVTAHNYLPFEGTSTVTSAGSYLAVSGYDFADQNANDFLEPDETVVLSLTVRNLGTLSATGVSATVTDNDPFLQISGQNSNFGDLNPGEEMTVTDFLTFEIDDTCTNSLGGRFDLEITNDALDIFPATIGVVISTPVLAYASNSAVNFIDHSFPEPGDSVDLSVTISNDGLMNAENAQVVLTSSDVYIDFIDSAFAIGAIQSGQIGEGTFLFEIDPMCPVPHFALMNAVLTDGVYGFADSFYVSIGAVGLCDDMEAGEVLWTHSGTGDLWHRSQRNCHSDSTSWYCGDEGAGEYNNNMEASLTSAAFQVAANSTFSFWCQYDFTTYGTDGCYVELTDNGGADWQTLSYIGSGGALPDSLLNIGNQWVKYNFSLENYSAGQTLQIRFRFKSDGSDVAEGFYLDDVVVTALVNSPVNDLTIRLDGDDAILSWTAPIGADSYQIYRSATPIFEPIGSPFATSTSTEWKDTNVLLEPGPYFYLVIAVRE